MGYLAMAGRAPLRTLPFPRRGPCPQVVPVCNAPPKTRRSPESPSASTESLLELRTHSRNGKGVRCQVHVLLPAGVQETEPAGAPRMGTESRAVPVSRPGGRAGDPHDRLGGGGRWPSLILLIPSWL